jgi:hypothetical protein
VYILHNSKNNFSLVEKLFLISCNKFYGKKRKMNLIQKLFMKKAFLIGAIFLAFAFAANAQANQVAKTKKTDSAKAETVKFTPPKIVKDAPPPPALPHQ